MKNPTGGPPSASRPRLTADQAVDVKSAGAALGASMNDADPGNYCEHLGALEYHVQALLDVIADLTGGAS